MRLNKFLSENTKLSRRKADLAIAESKVKVNGKIANIGQSIEITDEVIYEDKKIVANQNKTILLLNKPEGYVCSRNGQGSKTIYSLLPANLHNLNPVGRLDKNSCGLLVMTNDGDLLNQLAHPSYSKNKIYEVTLDSSINQSDINKINSGVILQDGVSNIHVKLMSKNQKDLLVTMQEGRNRQIRRTFQKLGYEVTKLRRISFGEYHIEGIESGKYILK